MRVVLLLLAFLIASGAAAEGFAVVVSRESAIEELSVRTIRDIFLRRRQFEMDVRLVPVNLLGENTARIGFEEGILEMSRDELNRYWINNHFQGVSPPTTQASLVSIKAFVERVNGAIGYLPLTMVDENLKVVHEF